MSHLIRNSVANAIFGLLPLLVSFLVTPITISVLGVQTYGLLQLILSLLGYLTLVDLNISVALVKYIAEYRSQDRGSNMARLTQTAMWLYTVLGAVLLAVTWVSSGRVVAWLRISGDASGPAQFSLRLLAVVGLLSLLQGGLNSMLNGYGAYGLSAAITSALTILTGIGTCVVGWLGGDIRTIIGFQAVLNGVGLLVTFGFVRRRFPLKAILPRLDRVEAKRLARFSLLSAGGRVAAVVDNSVDRLAVGTLLGAGRVAFYSVPLTLARIVGSFNTRLASVLLPAASGLQTAGDRDGLIRLYCRASRLIAVFSAFVVALVTSVGPAFLGVWLGPDFGTGSAAVLRWLAFGYFLASLTAVPTFFMDGLGYPYLTAGTYLAQVAFYSTLVVFLTGKFGIVGTAMAYAVGCGVISPLFIWYAEQRVLRVKRASRPGFYVRLAAAAGIGSVANGWAANRLAVHGWASLCLMAAGLALSQVAVLWACGLLEVGDWRLAASLFARIRGRLAAHHTP